MRRTTVRAVVALGDGEITAAILVAAHTGATEIVVRDPPGNPVQAHDFDLVLPGGRVLALEVTKVANPAEISQWKAIGKREWNATKLGDSWSLSLRQGGGPPGGIGKLRKKVEALLAVLEQYGVDRFAVADPDGSLPQPVRDAIASLWDLGVRRANRLRDTGETWIFVASSGAYTTSPQAVNAAVEPLAQGNAAKLLRARADERHIFLWVDSTIHGADLMLNDDLAPESPPNLPDGIDAAWVARAAIRPTDPVSRLWRVTACDPWQILVGKQRP